MIKFKVKNFGLYDIVNSTVKGAGIGGSIGTVTGTFGVHLPKFKLKDGTTRTVETTTTDTKTEGNEFNGTKTVRKEVVKESQNKGFKELMNENPKLQMMTAGTILGAALGFLVGTGKEIAKFINQKSTVNARILADVVKELIRLGYKEDIDFTREPKISTDNKMKVCLVVSKVSGAQQVIVNAISDLKLQKVLDDVVKSLPKNVSSTTNITDRYNDITLTTIPDKTTPKMIAGIAERFIKAKYPVYLIEVG